MAIILGIESSCDDTAAALVADGHRVLAEVVASQAEAFAKWGGVVPELAARAHIALLPELVQQVFDQAQVRPSDITAVAVSAWPGLIGSLIAGVTAAKVMAARWGCPLLAVDHIHAHLAAVALGRDQVAYPALGLVVSGGHSHFYRRNSATDITVLGGTIDDAAGEAFDKAAAILGLGYPGGPQIDALAAEGDSTAFDLPRSLLHSGDLRLSFAGLKTALLYRVRGPLGRDPLTLSAQGLRDAAASFQAALVGVLVAKAMQAVEREGLRSVHLGGGVACNSGLRQAMAEACAQRHISLLLPQPRHCADNAAMVAAAGYNQWQVGNYADLHLAPLPTGASGPRRLKAAAASAANSIRD